MHVNADAVVNLSSAVNDFMIKSHDKFYEVIRDIMWLNLTIYNQSAIYMALRLPELSLLLLTQNIDSLLAAVQCVLHGKLLLSLVSPSVLQRTLRDVSLHLPENYDLAAGAKLQIVLEYYQLVKVAFIGDPHSLNIVMNIPMRTAEQQFTLYKFSVLPAIVPGDILWISHTLVFREVSVTTSS
jgi:hypothetical protein